MSGPPPKPAHLRQRQNKKTTHATLEAAPAKAKVPEIPNPDEREWHPLTVASWDRAWRSPMASQYLDADIPAMGRLAVLWDEYNKHPGKDLAAEIRLQEQRFGLTPLDRSRLQWEVARGDEAERKRPRAPEPQRRTGTHDPRAVLQMVK